jgi:hypothetical protein
MNVAESVSNPAQNRARKQADNAMPERFQAA